MSWTDEEIDTIFGESSDRHTFEYRPEYWKDIEKQLPVNKTRKPLFWWLTGSAFIIGFMSLFFVEVQSNDTKFIFTESANNSGSNESIKEKSTSVIRKNETIENTASLYENTSEASRYYEAKQNNSLPNQVTTNTTSQNLAENVDVSNPNTENQLLTASQDNAVQENSVIEIAEEILTTDKENIVLVSMPIELLQTEQISAEIVTGDLLAKKQSTVKLFVEVNGALGQSWTQTNENSNSINGSLGIASGIEIPLNKFILSAGLGFQATKLGDLKIKERTKVYGFGSSILENTYQINSIYAVNLPISVSYLTGRHSVSVGVTTSMNLFTGLSRTQSMDGNQTEYGKGIANTSLFNRFGIQPSVGYGFYINEKLQIGVRANVQILQPIQSDRFIGTTVQMPIEGQFYLKRTIKF